MFYLASPGRSAYSIFRWLILFFLNFSTGTQLSLTSSNGDGIDFTVDKTPSEEDAASVVSGMSDYVNGDLGMIEDSVQELKEHVRREDSAKQDDVAFDIRPEVSVQAENKLVCTLLYSIPSRL